MRSPSRLRRGSYVTPRSSTRLRGVDDGCAGVYHYELARTAGGGSFRVFAAPRAVDRTSIQVLSEVMTLVVVAVLIVAIAAGAAVPLAVWWAERRRGPARPPPPLIHSLLSPRPRAIQHT